MKRRQPGYMRVLPRDLFNEAKLLKCVGRLALLIHDGMADPLALHHDTDEDQGFSIDQWPHSGRLYVANLHWALHNLTLSLGTNYNDKSAWPLWCEWEHPAGHEGEVAVFDDEGNLSESFQALLAGELVSD